MVGSTRLKIWGEKVATLAWDARTKTAAIEFDEVVLEKGWDLAPLQMPLEKIARGQQIFSFPNLAYETFKGLPGLAADGLPDDFGNKLINRWLRSEGRDVGSFTPIERLCYMGRRGMGAMEFEPTVGLKTSKSEVLEVGRLVRLANAVVSEREELQARLDEEKGLQQIIQVGTSAGGARAKAIIAYNPKTNEVRSGQVENLKGFDYFLIKFDGVTNEALGDPQGYGRIEYAYYLMAKAAGIEMTECALYEEHERAHFMTKRFDRNGDEKLHMQSLCALGHLDFNQRHTHSYERLFDTMRELGLPYSAAEEMYRRMCFNVLARNHDDHTKNHAFLMNQKGEWSLSPAYDITFAYNPNGIWTKDHLMGLNGKFSDLDEEDLLAFAKTQGLKKPKKLLEPVKAAISDWQKFAKEAGVPEKQSKVVAGFMIM